MAAPSLARFRPELARHEGGYSNHPSDAGGATFHGITQAVYDEFRRRKGWPIRDVREIEPDEETEIWRRYWTQVGGDELPAGPDVAVFDAGVNSGPRQALLWLERELGQPDDGTADRLTITAANVAPNKVALIRSFCARRLSFMQSIKDRRTGQLLWGIFGRGWGRRVAEVEAFAVGLALEAAGRSAASIAAHADAEAAAASRTRRRNQTAAAGTGGTGGAASGAAAVDGATGAPLPTDGVPVPVPHPLRDLTAEPSAWLDTILFAGGAVLLVVSAIFLVRAWRAGQRRDAYARKGA